MGLLPGRRTGAGVVYKVDTSGHETVLYSFTGGADGGSPSRCNPRLSRQPLRDYRRWRRTGHGVVFKVDTSGHETVLYSFTGGADGATRIQV